jgi:hypothetical protein
VSAFPRGSEESQYNAVLSAHHSFAAPIPPGLLWGRRSDSNRGLVGFRFIFARTRFRPDFIKIFVKRNTLFRQINIAQVVGNQREMAMAAIEPPTRGFQSS